MRAWEERCVLSVRVRWIFGMYSWQEQGGDGQREGAWLIHFHVDPAKPPAGQLTASPRPAVFPFVCFFFNSKTHWADSDKLRTETVFSPSAGKLTHGSSNKHGHFFFFLSHNGAMSFYCNLQSSTGIRSEQILGGNKQERKKSSSTRSKARKQNK